MIDSDDINTYLTTEDLAVRYDLKPDTIKRWRWRGHGPTFYRVGPAGIPPKTPMVRYKLADVLAWEQSNNITPIN
jgi:hypothetical protein